MKLKLLALTLLAACVVGTTKGEPPPKGSPIDRLLPANRIDDKKCDPAPVLPVKADEPKKVEVVHPRGRKNPSEEVLKVRHEEAFKRHDHRMKGLPNATPATFDCRTLGWVGPVCDQGQCGTCWDVSGADNITSAFIKAGLAKNDGSFLISLQFLLDQCGYKNAGCNGDDAINVLDYAKTSGIPSQADYGPYTAVQGRCKFKSGTTLYKLADWGYCTPSQQQGVASVQDIKNAMVANGPISTAIAADNSWDSVGADGVIPYRKLTPNDIDHDVQMTGWDDNKQIQGAPTKGAWLVKNQWSTSWGANGYCWIAYGSHQIGTEAAWGTVAVLPPPVPPTPPVPPVPPVPPQPGVGYTGTITKIKTYKDGVEQPGETTIVGGTAPSGTTLEADLKTAGVSPAIIADVLQLVADLKAKAGFAVYAVDIMKIMMDLKAAEPPAVPSPMPMSKEKTGSMYRKEQSWTLAA